LVGIIVAIAAVIVPIIEPEIRVFFKLEVPPKPHQFDLTVQKERVAPVVPDINNSREPGLPPTSKFESRANIPDRSERNEFNPLVLDDLGVKIIRDKPEDHEKSFGHLTKEKEKFAPINSN